VEPGSSSIDIIRLKKTESHAGPFNRILGMAQERPPLAYPSVTPRALFS
jgi:hypothetical protein